MAASLETQRTPELSQSPDTGRGQWQEGRASPAQSVAPSAAQSQPAAQSAAQSGITPGAFGVGEADLRCLTLPAAQIALEQQVMACLGPGMERLARSGLLGARAGTVAAAAPVDQRPLLSEGLAGTLTGKVAGYAAALLRENWAGGG